MPNHRTHPLVLVACAVFLLVVAAGGSWLAYDRLVVAPREAAQAAAYRDWMNAGTEGDQERIAADSKSRWGVHPLEFSHLARRRDR